MSTRTPRRQNKKAQEEFRTEVVVTAEGEVSHRILNSAGEVVAVGPGAAPAAATLSALAGGGAGGSSGVEQKGGSSAAGGAVGSSAGAKGELLEGGMTQKERERMLRLPGISPKKEAAIQEARVGKILARLDEAMHENQVSMVDVSVPRCGRLSHSVNVVTSWCEEHCWIVFMLFEGEHGRNSGSRLLLFGKES